MRWLTTFYPSKAARTETREINVAYYIFPFTRTHPDTYLLRQVLMIFLSFQRNAQFELNICHLAVTESKATMQKLDKSSSQR
jgi:hypothetical protein